MSDSVQPHRRQPTRLQSLGFCRQEHWSGLPFPLPGVLPDPGRETESPTLQADSLPSEPPGNPICSFSSQQSPHSFSLLILFWPFISWASENQMAKWQLGGRYSMHENNGVKECGASIHTSPVKSRDFVPNGNKPGFVTSVHILWSRWDSVLSKNLTPLLYLAVCLQKLLRWLRDKESVYPAEEASLVPGWGRSPGEGNGNRLQYSCLGNLRDRGALWATVLRDAKSGTQLTDWAPAQRNEQGYTWTYQQRSVSTTQDFMDISSGPGKEWVLQMQKLSYRQTYETLVSSFTLLSLLKPLGPQVAMREGLMYLDMWIMLGC